MLPRATPERGPSPPGRPGPPFVLSALPASPPGVRSANADEIGEVHGAGIDGTNGERTDAPTGVLKPLTEEENVALDDPPRGRRSLRAAGRRSRSQGPSLNFNAALCGLARAALSSARASITLSIDPPSTTGHVRIAN